MDNIDKAHVADLQRISDQRAANLMAAWDRNAILQAENEMLKFNIEKLKSDHETLIAEYDAIVFEMVESARLLLNTTHDTLNSVKSQSDKDWLIDQLREQLAQHEPTWI